VVRNYSQKQYPIAKSSRFLNVEVVEDFDFEQDSFEPVLENCVKSIIKLVQDSTENFASSEVLNIIGVISKQAGPKVGLLYANK
jgi:hypothetical protein